jgi:hypothetical protein
LAKDIFGDSEKVQKYVDDIFGKYDDDDSGELSYDAK